jgi:hypothetical protein
MLVKTLKGPVVALLIIGGTHFTLEAIMPDLKNFFTPVVVGAILVTVGTWLGYRAVQNGGNLMHALIAGAILGLLPVMLDIVGFGILLGRGIPQGIQAGVFGFTVVVVGSLIGSAFTLRQGKAGI